MRSKKLELERRVLDLSLPLLKRMYGEIEIDPQQMDRPDAAVKVVKPRKQVSRDREGFLVGIEITTVDPSDALSYFNDTKHSKDVIKTQMENALEHGADEITRPLRKMRLETPAVLIYNAVIKKADKYLSYASDNRFREIVLVCFSENIRVSDSSFSAMLNQTAPMLKEVDFPYDRVLFLGLRDGGTQKVYDRHGTVQQARVREGGESITRVDSGVRRMGESFNFYKMFEIEPLIQPRGKK